MTPSSSSGMASSTTLLRNSDSVFVVTTGRLIGSNWLNTTAATLIQTTSRCNRENLAMADTERLKETMHSAIAGMMDELAAGIEASGLPQTGVPHAQDPLWAALIPARVSREADLEKRFRVLFDRTRRKLAAMVAAESLGYGAESYDIVGTIRAGRLKRIAQVLHQSEHSEAGQRTPKSDWASELIFITQGRGERIPVRMICDLYAEDTSSKRRYAFELDEHLRRTAML